MVVVAVYRLGGVGWGDVSMPTIGHVGVGWEVIPLSVTWHLSTRLKQRLLPVSVDPQEGAEGAKSCLHLSRAMCLCCRRWGSEGEGAAGHCGAAGRQGEADAGHCSGIAGRERVDLQRTALGLQRGRRCCTAVQWDSREGEGAAVQGEGTKVRERGLQCSAA